MAKFFETFDVIEGDGNWTAGPYPVDTLSAGISTQTQDICNPPVAVNEVQTITISGSPTGGTFTLSLAYPNRSVIDTTTGLAYNVTAANMQTALRALGNIGAGNVTVTGAAGGPYTVTFIGALASTQIPAFSANTSGLTGGTPSVKSVITVPGNVLTPDSYPLTTDAVPFACSAYGIVPPRCAPDYYEQFVQNQLVDAVEWQISNALWYGPSNFSGAMYLENPVITTIPRTGDPYTIVGAALQAAFAQNPSLKPTIHLGWQSAMALQLGLASLQLPFVVPHGYPANAIAVTGPVVVRLGTPETVTTEDVLLNRQYLMSTRLAAIEFDPSQAVRVADA